MPSPTQISVVCYINLLKTKRRLIYLKTQPYRAVNTFQDGYKNQPVNDV